MLSNFCIDKSKSDGLASWCRTCHSDYSKRKIIEKNRNKVVVILPPNTKICNKEGCIFEGKPQSINNFNKRTSSPDGLQSMCIICRMKYDKEQFIKNKEKNKKYRRNIKTKICTFELCPFEGQPQPISEFYIDNAKPNGYKSWCKTCAKESVKYWNQDNLERKAKYRKDRYKSNINIRLNVCMSGLIYYSLTRKSNGKQGHSWKDLVDFTVEDLKKHLKDLFQPGMTWDNYGKEWELDHIKPISFFDIISFDCEDFKKCWSLENLQPLWTHDNRIKSNLISANGITINSFNIFG
jgi:hypothetical protein